MVEDGRHRLHTGVVGTGVVGFDPVRARGLFVPVVNAPDEGRDQLHARLTAGHRLTKGKQQRQVAMDAFALELRRSLDALPGGGDLDQHPLAANALRLVQRHEATRPRHGGGGVKTQAGVHLGGHTPGHMLQDRLTKAHQQVVHHLIQRLPTVGRHGIAQHRGIVGLLHRFQDQGRVGGGILWPELRQLQKVAGVGDHGGVLLEGFELVHGGLNYL